MDILLAEEDSSDEEYRPDDEEEDETAEDVRLLEHSGWMWLEVIVNCSVCVSVCVRADLPGERPGELGSVPQGEPWEPVGGGRLQPLAGQMILRLN